MSFDNLMLTRPWRCDVTGNIVGTDTQRIGYTCDCQGCRAADTLAANVKELAEIAEKLEQTRVELGETQLVLATTERNCEAEIAEIRAENERLMADVETFWKPQFDEQCLRAEAAESEIAEIRAENERLRAGIADIELDIHLASGIAGYDLKPALAKIRSLGLLDGEVDRG